MLGPEVSQQNTGQSILPLGHPGAIFDFHLPSRPQDVKEYAIPPFFQCFMNQS